MRNAPQLISSTVILLFGITVRAEDWPGWRGPRGDGTSAETNVPTIWDGTSGRNIRWKTRVAGTGYSSPVISHDVIFVTSCDQMKQKRLLHCFDIESGAERWSQTVVVSQLEGKHQLNSYASGTPASDGDNVYVAFFRTDDVSGKKGVPGEMIVASYDYQGKPNWSASVGAFSSVHGFCTSPVLYADLVLVNGDHDGESYIAALSKSSGKVVWKTPREFRTRSYVTPLLQEVDGKMQAVMTGSKRIAGFNALTGQRLWWIDGPTEQFVASMVFDRKYFYLSAGFPTHHVMAIRPGGHGDVSDSHVAWHVTDAKCYVPSPVVANDLLFVADDRGIAHCFDTHTGDRLWRARLGPHFSASLITAGGFVYFTSDDGVTTVMKADREPTIVEKNAIGESVYASPAISNGRVILRGTNHLFCIENQ